MNEWLSGCFNLPYPDFYWVKYLSDILDILVSSLVNCLFISLSTFLSNITYLQNCFVAVLYLFNMNPLLFHWLYRWLVFSLWHLLLWNLIQSVFFSLLPYGLYFLNLRRISGPSQSWFQLCRHNNFKIVNSFQWYLLSYF